MAFTNWQLELVALKIYDEREPGSLNKYNVLGGRDEGAGSFEMQLDATFTPSDRVINDLQVRGYLEPDYWRMMNSEETSLTY